MVRAPIAKGGFVDCVIGSIVCVDDANSLCGERSSTPAPHASKEDTVRDTAVNHALMMTRMVL